LFARRHQLLLLFVFDVVTLTGNGELPGPIFETTIYPEIFRLLICFGRAAEIPKEE